LGQGRVIAYRYDFLGRIDRIETPVGPITFDFDSAGGRVIRLLPNGVRSVFQASPGGPPEEITHLSPRGDVLARFRYSYEPGGLVSAVTESTAEGDKTVSYTYDAVGRLIAALDSREGKTEYRYDDAGNRIESHPVGKPPLSPTTMQPGTSGATAAARLPKTLPVTWHPTARNRPNTGSPTTA